MRLCNCSRSRRNSALALFGGAPADECFQEASKVSMALGRSFSAASATARSSWARARRAVMSADFWVFHFFFVHHDLRPRDRVFRDGCRPLRSTVFELPHVLRTAAARLAGSPFCWCAMRGAAEDDRRGPSELSEVEWPVRIPCLCSDLEFSVWQFSGHGFPPVIFPAGFVLFLAGVGLGLFAGNALAAGTVRSRCNLRFAGAVQVMMLPPKVISPQSRSPVWGWKVSGMEGMSRKYWRHRLCQGVGAGRRCL